MAIKKKILMAAIMAVVVQGAGLNMAFADEEVTIDEGDIAMSVTPMRENIVLNPGDEYRSSFSVVNPGAAIEDLYYKIDIQPFSVNENYDFAYDVENDSTQITKWIELESPAKGVVHPNESVLIEFKIKVPQTAPAGGQYASITVSTDFESAADAGVNINEAMSIAHLVLAEITGDTIYGGDILDIGVDSLILGGDVRVYSIVQNTGNVHALATYNMEVKSVFSGEVVYSNNDIPETHYVLPERTYYDETIWSDTPTIGIFNVLYTVEFQGLKSEVSRIVIVCPWWALAIMVFALLMLTLRIITLFKLRKQRKNEMSA